MPVLQRTPSIGFGCALPLLVNRTMAKGDPQVGCDSRDGSIRGALREFVRGRHSGCGDFLVLEELALYGGEVRADLVTLNGVSHGYEIKSGRDDLARLSAQMAAYNAVFECATLVSAPCHLERAGSVVPPWWGILEARMLRGDVVLTELRSAERNPCPDGRAIACLLWRSEALRILSSLGLERGIRSKPMDYLADRLSESMSSERLSMVVREALRARGDWRFAARLKQCGGRFRRRASLWRSQHVFSASIPQ